MRRVLPLGVILLLGLAGSAQAHGFAHGLGHAGDALGAVLRLEPLACPAGVPVQMITVVNQANVKPWALGQVETAVVDQSMQLRAAWGTPCVQFAGGGWPVYLQSGDGTASGAHYIDNGQPDAYVYTNGVTYQAWSSTFSHELVEMLVDPQTNALAMQPGGAQGRNLEIADPVQDRAYRLGGTWVSDFVTPAWFAGGTHGACATIGGGVPGYTCDGPLIAPAGAPGPYDQMGVLTGPWQTAS